MTMPPVGWIMEQQRQAAVAAEAEYHQRITTFLLLLTSHSRDELSIPTQETHMQFATLIVGRVRFEAVEVTSDGHLTLLEKSEAQQYYEEEIEAPLRAAYQAAKEEAAERQRTFIHHAVVNEALEVKRDTGRLMKEKMHIDEVQIGDQIFEVQAGNGREFVEIEAKRNIPDPDPPDIPAYSSWYDSNKRDVRTWRVELHTAEGSVPLSFDAGNWSWGYPIQGALSLLDQLDSDGWQVLHISEDHGLYRGADAQDESYPTRVRYLLRRPAPSE